MLDGGDSFRGRWSAEAEELVDPDEEEDVSEGDQQVKYGAYVNMGQACHTGIPPCG